ncbi:hypothetical protein GALL_552510 [mine drainage metagenome]|uniref:Uncharacterized protein n=1 Tax=mine drainage metagenome TaxID=410659 RepID=A0A1J5NWT3_9ZZZZ
MGRLLKPGQQPKRRGLAAAGRADQGGDLTRAEAEIEGPERAAAPGIVHLDSGEFGDGVH